MAAEEYGATKNSDRTCRECAAPIALKARKCRACGSFQDARRFLTVSQSSLAFVLAFLALVGHFTENIKGSVYALHDWVLGSSFAMKVTLVDIEEETLTVILSNRRSYLLGVSRATCFFHFPANKAEFADKVFERNSLRWTGEAPPEHEATQWVGTVWLGFKPSETLSLQPFEVRMVTMQRAIIGLPSTSVSVEAENPTSFCSILGAGQNNSDAVGGLIIDPEELMFLDVLSLLKSAERLGADTSEGQRRNRLIEEIEEIRSLANN